MIFAPAILKFAFHKEEESLKVIFDKEIKDMKQNTSSIYYNALDKWLPPEDSGLPNWAINAGIILVILLIILSILVMVFRKMVIDRSNKLIEKDKLLFVQSKKAALGEMISLIAHQWRQPLSLISVVAGAISLKLELGQDVSKQELQKSMQDIDDSIKFMDTTLNDFRNFYKPDSIKQSVALENLILSVEKILSSRLKSINVDITKEIKLSNPLTIYRSDLMHIFLIILNNAIDILIENKIDVPKIDINGYEKNGVTIIEISDNGGGIPPHLLKKIGEPYFTTKNQQGTGIGIYTVQTMLHEHFNGKLSWYNKKDGACFIISIPN